MSEDNRELLDKFYEKKIDEVMEKRLENIPIIEQDLTVKDAAVFLTVKNRAWVVESKDNRRLVGVITEKDFLNLFCPRRRTSYFGHPDKMSLHYELFEKAEHIMSRDPIICKADEKVRDALNKMTTHNVRNLPVVEKNEIVGEITIHHLLKKFYGIINSLGDDQ